MVPVEAEPSNVTGIPAFAVREAAPAFAVGCCAEPHAQATKRTSARFTGASR
jgi:hypothetical protein